jgi:hypothetical protein
MLNLPLTLSEDVLRFSMNSSWPGRNLLPSIPFAGGNPRESWVAGALMRGGRGV